MDYRERMGVSDLARAVYDGQGVRIAVLDSGVPNFHVGVARSRGATALSGSSDDMGHATAIASILFGKGAIRGICCNAEPYYIKVLDSKGFGSVRAVSRGIYEAVDCGADIINLSLGYARTDRCPRRLAQACDAAREAGVAVFCAAGNDGTSVNWPAALESTICVGSSGKDGLRAPFSSPGEVDFLAPGMGVEVLCRDGRVKRVSGTSFSTAEVTGVAALVVAKCRKDGWTPDPDALVEELRLISRDVGEPGWDRDAGYGVIGEDPVVGMDTGRGFFDIIFSRVAKFLGLNKKEH